MLTGVQRPLTYFGLPLELLAGLAAASVVIFGVFVAVGLVPAALIAALAVFAGGWFFFFRRMRRDAHFPQTLFLVPRFWGRRHRRALTAGHPPGGKA